MKLFFLVISVLFSFTLSVSAETGKEIFDRYCTVCHSANMASMFGAPAAHDISAWNERKENAFKRAVEKNSSIKNEVGEKKDSYVLAELVNTANAGTDKGMPPKGTCSDCTDDDLTSVIKFMSE